MSRRGLGRTQICVQRKEKESIVGWETRVRALARSQTALQQLLWLATWKPPRTTMGHYQRVRGHYSPARAARLQCGSWVPAECFALRVAATAPLFSLPPPCAAHPPPLPFLKWQSFLLQNVSHVSRAEGRGSGSMVVVHLLLLLKISLVKFSLSSKAGSSDLEVYRECEGEEAERERQKKKRGVGACVCVCWGGGWRETESEQPAQAKLVRGAQYVLERFANRSLFFIAEMKAAWASRECQTHLFICVVDCALCLCVQVWELRHATHTLRLLSVCNSDTMLRSPRGARIRGPSCTHVHTDV